MANSHSISLVKSSSQYLSITDAAQTGLDFTGDLTFECWIKLNSYASGQLHDVIGKRGATVRSYVWRINHSGTTATNIFFNYVSGGVGASAHVSPISTDLTTGTWYHLAFVLDISLQSEVFLDGVSVGTGTPGASSIDNTTEPFLIGWKNAGSDYFDGLIDEMRVWNDIRTSTEISNNYQAELVGTEANLQGYWKFNNDLLDATANNNDLTNNNSATFSTDVPFTGSLSQLISEVVTIVDTKVNNPKKIFGEFVTVIETFTKSITRVFQEIVSIVINFTATPTKIFMEVVSVTDTFLRAITKNIAEVITMVVSFPITRGKLFIEAISISETKRLILNGDIVGIWTKIKKSVTTWIKSGKPS